MSNIVTGVSVIIGNTCRLKPLLEFRLSIGSLKMVEMCALPQVLIIYYTFVLRNTHLWKTKESDHKKNKAAYYGEYCCCLKNFFT